MVKAILIFIVILSTNHYGECQNIYDHVGKELKPNEYVTEKGAHISIPDKNEQFLIVIFNPNDNYHLRQINKIDVFSTEYPGINVYAVSTESPFFLLEQENFYKVKFLLDVQQTGIKSMIGENDCGLCFRVLLIDKNKIVYIDGSFEINFVKALLKKL